MYVHTYGHGEVRKEHMAREKRKIIRMHGDLVFLGLDSREGRGLVDDTFSIPFAPSMSTPILMQISKSKLPKKEREREYVCVCVCTLIRVASNVH